LPWDDGEKAVSQVAPICFDLVFPLFVHTLIRDIFHSLRLSQQENGSATLTLPFSWVLPPLMVP
jgi:hypothetical protein